MKKIKLSNGVGMGIEHGLSSWIIGAQASNE